MTAQGPNEYIFKEGPGGLEFVGDFDGLYKASLNPWDQSGDTEEYYQYYIRSRTRLIGILRKRLNGDRSLRGLEIGCGHGHVTDYLNYCLGSRWDGVDISPTAISHARELYPRHRFFVGDIIKGFEPGIRYDVVVLGQLLWYVMHEMDNVLDNCYNMLVPNGLLVISQAFLTTEQRYGIEIADGFDGTLKLLLNYRDKFKIVEACYDEVKGFTHYDGLIVMRRRSL